MFFDVSSSAVRLCLVLFVTILCAANELAVLKPPTRKTIVLKNNCFERLVKKGRVLNPPDQLQFWEIAQASSLLKNLARSCLVCLALFCSCLMIQLGLFRKGSVGFLIQASFEKCR